MPKASSERSPLLRNQEDGGQERTVSLRIQLLHKLTPQLVEFGEKDDANPSSWSKWKKLANVAVIASMASQSDSSSYHLQLLIKVQFSARLQAVCSRLVLSR